MTTPEYNVAAKIASYPRRSKVTLHPSHHDGSIDDGRSCRHAQDWTAVVSKTTTGIYFLLLFSYFSFFLNPANLRHCHGRVFTLPTATSVV